MRTPGGAGMSFNLVRGWLEAREHWRIQVTSFQAVYSVNDIIILEVLSVNLYSQQEQNNSTVPLCINPWCPAGLTSSLELHFPTTTMTTSTTTTTTTTMTSTLNGRRHAKK